MKTLTKGKLREATIKRLNEYYIDGIFACINKLFLKTTGILLVLLQTIIVS